MVFIDVIFSAFLIGGICLIRWSSTLSTANLRANRAFAESVGWHWLQLWLAKSWQPRLSRVTTIAVGVIWIAIAVVALVAANL